MGYIGHSKNSYQAGLKLKAMARRQQALELRMQGKSHKEIASEMGCSTAAVCNMISRIVAERVGHQVEMVREHANLALSRLDRLIQALWPKAMAGDVESIQAMIRVEERRAKLLGLDAPQKVQAEIELNHMPDQELIGLAERIGLSFVALPPGDGGEPLMLPVHQGPVGVETPSSEPSAS